MQLIKNSNCIFFDVDDTLVLWDNKYKNEDHSNCVLAIDPIIGAQELVPHDEHIAYLKRSRAMGKTVVVWSAGGWEWAHSVVKALNLEQYVDAVMEKPQQYVDDINCTEFMGIRIYKEMKK